MEDTTSNRTRAKRKQQETEQSGATSIIHVIGNAHFSMFKAVISQYHNNSKCVCEDKSASFHLLQYCIYLEYAYVVSTTTFTLKSAFILNIKIRSTRSKN